MMNNRDYWEKRTADIFADLDKRDLTFFFELQGIYARYTKEIQKELFLFYKRYANENNITIKEARKRISAEDLSDYVHNANAYRKQVKKDPEALERLNKQYQSAIITRLEMLHASMHLQLLKMGIEANRSFFSHLKSVIQYVYRKITRGTPPSMIDEKAIKTILKLKWEGGNYSTRIWDNVDRLSRKLKEELVRGFVKGSGASEMARELRKDFNVSRAQSETLLRTESAHVANATTIQRYIDMGLTKYQFSAHLDNRTSKVCRSLDDKIFSLKDYQPGVNAPPMHPNCRSTVVPDDEEIGKTD